ncbi:MAG: FAD-binding oxidoreductase [Clostridiaceae bacterium]|nr:FAD-binding oxidoreductase [Clostridiaceae bacterium]
MEYGHWLPLSSQGREYLRDESRREGSAEQIAFPRSEADIIACLRDCSAKHCRVTVQGGRTGLAAGAVPDGGRIINLARMDGMNGMAESSDGAFLLKVQPGLTLLALRQALTTKKIDTSGWDEVSKAIYQEFLKSGEWFFTPDPTEATATIGGMAACNASGARSYLYGATRGHIEALRMALADGRMMEIRRGTCFAQGLQARYPLLDGGMLKAVIPGYKMPDCKNASGYFASPDMDLIDLLIGSDGTLGVITELELKLMQVPAVIWGASLLMPDEHSAMALAQRLRHSKLPLAAIEYFDGGALDILREQKKEGGAFGALSDVGCDIGAVIYCELHCKDEGEAREVLLALGELCAACGGAEKNTWVARNDTDRDRLLFFRHAVPESVNMRIDRRRQVSADIVKVASDIAVPEEHFGELVNFYRETLAESGLESATWGHIGDCHLHVNMLPRSHDELLTAKSLLMRWAKAAASMGGAVSAEHGVGKLKRDYLRTMYGDDGIAQSALVKRAFDPENRLGAGNLFDPSEVTVCE